MENKKIGFFENSAGERSWTRLINTFLFVFILCMWGIESWSKGGIVPLDPTVLGLLVAAMTGSGINKWLESNSDKTHAKLIKHVLSKVKK